MSVRQQDAALTKLAVVFGFVVLLGTPYAAQTRQPSQGPLQFEVASVRPNRSEPIGLPRVEARPNGSVVAVNVPLRALITFAYGLELYQTIDGPRNLLDERFDLMAKASADVNVTNVGERGPLNLMMQQLLAERFKLMVRWEDRPQAGYVLTRLKGDGSLGPSLVRSDLECPQRTPTTNKTQEDPRRCRLSIIGNELNAVGQRMADIARMLTLALRSPVMDRTGLAGRFDARMAFDARELLAMGLPAGSAVPPNVATPSVPTDPSLFTALQEQLGLRLERQRVPVSVLIVEHVEPPTEN